MFVFLFSSVYFLFLFLFSTIQISSYVNIGSLEQKTVDILIVKIWSLRNKSEWLWFDEL